MGHGDGEMSGRDGFLWRRREGSNTTEVFLAVVNSCRRGKKPAVQNSCAYIGSFCLQNWIWGVPIISSWEAGRDFRGGRRGCPWASSQGLRFLRADQGKARLAWSQFHHLPEAARG